MDLINILADGSSYLIGHVAQVFEALLQWKWSTAANKQIKLI